MRLEDLVVLTQEQLFNKLLNVYKSKATYRSGSYIIVKGEAPIMLLAHLDTVHDEPVRDICKTKDGNIIMSPQGIGGDDRCGVYALMTIYRKAKAKPWLLFTCDEETGGNGAFVFCDDYYNELLPRLNLKCLIEIDRKGSNDAVYYDCYNYDFEDFITNHGFKTAYGTFSDISVIAPELKVAAVNLSSGYYNAHTQHEYINRNELNKTIERVCEIVSESVNEDFPFYEYIEPYEYSDGYNANWNYDVVTKKNLNFADSIMYSELLNYYTENELDEIICAYGERSIAMMYESEFGEALKIEDDSQ